MRSTKAESGVKRASPDEFVVMDCAITGEGAGLSSEGCGEMCAVVVEIGESEAGKAAHRFIAEVHAAVLVTLGSRCR